MMNHAQIHANQASSRSLSSRAKEQCQFTGVRHKPETICEDREMGNAPAYSPKGLAVLAVQVLGTRGRHSLVQAGGTAGQYAEMLAF